MVRKKARDDHKTPIHPLVWVLMAAVVVFGILVIMDSAGGPATTGAAPVSPAPSTDARIAPDFSLVRADGGMMGIGDLRGKVVILDFWATWCAPCKREIPDFIDLQKTYGDRGLVVMGVALDKRDAVDAFIEQQGINYPILYGDKQISQLYGGITGIPTTFIIDRDGVIREKFVGYRPRKTFEEAIKKLL